MEGPGGLQSMGSVGAEHTERLHFHFSLSCIGEGNGNPLQCSCLENPRDGGAWWAAVYGSHRVGHDWSDLAAAAAACLRFICVHISRVNPYLHHKKTLHLKNNNGNNISYYKIIFRTLKSFHTTYLGKDLVAFERQEYVYLLNGYNIKYFSYCRGSTSI